MLHAMHIAVLWACTSVSCDTGLWL